MGLSPHRPTHWLALCALLTGASVTAFAAEEPSPRPPSWYQRKKAEEQRRLQYEQQLEQEKPVIGKEGSTVAQPKTVELSAPPEPEKKPSTPSLLFDKRALTASFDAGLSYLSQDTVNGLPISVLYGMGWWWKPDLILSGFGLVDAIFTSTHIYSTISVGPQLRYFLDDHWALTGRVGFQVSQGFSRVEATHIPPPPTQTALDLRSGLNLTAQVSRMFWLKRDLAVGPYVATRVGFQSERTYFEFSLGFTYQDGKPNLSGDLLETSPAISP